MASGVTRSAARGWAVPAVALHLVVLIDGLRAWLPSIAHVLGDLGTTSPVTLGLAAAPVFLLPFPAVLSTRHLPPRLLWWWAAAATAGARVALQFTDGGTPQLVFASLVVTAGLVALVALAAGAPSGHLVRVGVVTGLAGATALHLVLGTRDLLWRSGVGAVLLLLVLLGASLATAARLRRVPLWWPTGSGDGTLAPVWTRGPSWPWLAVGPAIALIGIVVAVPARIEHAVGWSSAAAGAALVAACGLAVLAAMLGPALGPRVAGLSSAALVLLGAIGASAGSGGGLVAGQLAVVVGVGAALGAPGPMPGDPGPRRRGAAAATSMLLFLVLGFLHYAAYDLPPWWPPDTAIQLAATVVAGVGIAAAIVGRDLAPSRTRPMRSLTGTALATGLVVALVLAVSPDRAAPTAAPDPALRIATYNLAAGFSADGRFVVDELADQLRALDADVVVLQEVDRGWMLNGGHDVLRLLAQDLGLPAVFAPAADDVWGNAVLSRHPVRDVTTQALPRSGTPMTRSLLSLVVEPLEGSPIAVVGTHLHHVPADADVRLAQARSVAAEASRLRGRGLPVVVAGDLNAELGAPELEPLSFLASAVPRDRPTWPSHDPQQRIDHILITPDLRTSDPVLGTSQASDHLPVAVTVRPAPTER